MTRRMLRGLGALLLLAALVIGFPIGLWLLQGWPLPHSVPTQDELTTLAQSSVPAAVWIGALTCLCWLVWLNLSIAVGGELIGQVRGSAVHLPGVTQPVQRLLAPLVAAIVLMLTLPAGRHAATGLVSPSSAHLSLDAGIGGAAQGADANHALAASPSAPAPAPERVHVVRSGEDMWGIAEHEMGRGPLYGAIFDLNQGVTQPDGRALTDPHWIFPGWRFRIPASPDEPPPAGQQAPSTTSPAPSPAPTQPHPAQPIAGATPISVTPAAVMAAPDAQPAPSASSAVSPTPTPTANGGMAGRGATAAPDIHPGSGPLVEVPGVGVVGLGLAGAIASAVVMGRRHAWRHWQPDDGGASLRAFEALVTEPVRSLERLHRRSQLPVIDVDDGEEDSGSESAVAPVTWRPPPPVPGWVVAAELDGHETVIDIGTLSGAGLEGPGAVPALRALILTFLMHAAVDQAEVLLVGDVDGLLPGLENVPGVTGLDDLDDAADRLGDEVRHREHLLDEHGVANFTVLATSAPFEETVALLAVVAGESTPTDPGALTALVERGRRLGMAVVWAGPSPVGPAIRVSADGGLSGEPGQQEALAALVVAGRLPMVRDDAAARLVEVVAAARGVTPPPVPVEPTVVPAVMAEPVPEPEPHGPAPDLPITAAQTLHVVPASPPIALVRICVLGRVRVLVDGREVTARRSRATEVLALLALAEDRRVELDQGLDRLFPDNTNRTSTHQMWRQALVAARAALRRAGCAGEAIRYDGRYYRLDPTLVSADVWDFDAAQDALALPRASDAQRLAALEQAASAYGGELLDGVLWTWVHTLDWEARREGLRCRASQVLDELAERYTAAGELRLAAAAVERALTVAPDAEHLHRRLMRLLGQLGCWHGIRSAYSALETRCSDLGLQPDEETRSLVAQLLAEERREARDTSTTA